MCICVGSGDLLHVLNRGQENLCNSQMGRVAPELRFMWVTTVC